MELKQDDVIGSDRYVLGTFSKEEPSELSPGWGDELVPSRSERTLT